MRCTLRFLREVTPYTFFDNLCLAASSRATFESQRHKSNLSAKLNTLCDLSPWSKFSLTSSVNNLSSCPLTKSELEFLGFGLSFAAKPNHTSCLVYFKDLDGFISKQGRTNVKDYSFLKGIIISPILHLFDNFNGLPQWWPLFFLR